MKKQDILYQDKIICIYKGLHKIVLLHPASFMGQEFCIVILKKRWFRWYIQSIDKSYFRYHKTYILKIVKKLTKEKRLPKAILKVLSMR